jgi:hypothetical protein
MRLVLSVVFWILVIATAVSALRAAHPGREPRLSSPRPSSVALWALVAIPSVFEFLYPPVLHWLMRDWASIRAGQVWRLVTSPVVQDGGPAGTVFNLVALGVVVMAAQEYWSAGRIWVTFWFGALAANLAVGPVLDPVGAGNSFATFALGCAVTSNALLSRPTRPVLLSSIGVLTCVALLAAVRDDHALACLIGILAGGVPPYGPSRRVPHS